MVHRPGGGRTDPDQVAPRRLCRRVERLCKGSACACGVPSIWRLSVVPAEPASFRIRWLGTRHAAAGRTAESRWLRLSASTPAAYCRPVGPARITQRTMPNRLRCVSTPQSFGQLNAVSPHCGMQRPSPHLPHAASSVETTPQSFGQLWAVSPHWGVQLPSPHFPQAAVAVCAVAHAFPACNSPASAVGTPAPIINTDANKTADKNGIHTFIMSLLVRSMTTPERD